MSSEDKSNTVEDGALTTSKLTLSKWEYDLFHEEEDVIMPVVRVKHISFGKTEKWKLYKGDKLFFTVESDKLGKKEKEFLRTVDGVNFLIGQCKQGFRSFNALKNEIKKSLKKA